MSLHRILLALGLLVPACAGAPDGGVAPIPETAPLDVLSPDAPDPGALAALPEVDQPVLPEVGRPAPPDAAEDPSADEGRPTAPTCPVAVAVVEEGLDVVPQTLLHLNGDKSYAFDGSIAAWRWTATQPLGSVSTFVPSDAFPNPTFEVNVVGEYVFTLDVWDTNGTPSCAAYATTVVVLPDVAIHVELLWHTPKDPDESDQGPEAGTDLDLHFLHDAYAANGPDLDGDGKPDGWYDQPFDCFWFNSHPNWGSFDPSIDDDPGLDRDDTDGAGPENLNLALPDDVVYRVGVHYFHDHEYGASLATVRIWCYGWLAYVAEDVLLVNRDLWDVATIDGTSCLVMPVAGDVGGAKITAEYKNPFFFQP